MSNLKLSSKYTDLKNYKEIKFSNLESTSINSEDYKKVKDTIKNLRQRYTSTFFASLLFVFLLSFLIISDINDGKQIFTSDYMIVLLAFLTVLSLSTYLFIKSISIKISAIKKSQYGILKSKYIRKKIVNDKIKEKYYATVLFPDSKNYLMDVICTKDVYNSLNEGNCILVISFDNRHAYAVKIN